MAAKNYCHKTFAQRQSLANSMTAIFFFQLFRFIIVTESFLTCLTLCTMKKTLIFQLNYVGNNTTCQST